ncbi:hypothetical protein BD626DRAFT_534061 [Schizophyllum amplum]|uniref:F-box domain-containing protein n=1 Tax=Schizophyllum amplum TaxID=97359 RepID=A0A550CSH3_9AGAR|nr:hypothetical protein BD626DRAFT_534061 [Auriculariopsis ampla]
MSRASNDTPLFPWDICQEIIEAFWWSSISNHDRVEFMLSSSLVSKTWRKLYTIVSFRDMHIPTPNYGLNMMHLGSLYNFIHDPAMNDMPAQMCRTITFHIQSSNLLENFPEENDECEMGRCATVTLYTLSNFANLLPNLRRVRFEYVNYPLTDVFHNLRLYFIPPQVDAIDLRYRFDSMVKPEIVSELRQEEDMRHYATWALANVKELTLIGGSRAVTREILRRTTNLRKLTVDEHGRVWDIPKGLLDTSKCRVVRI